MKPPKQGPAPARAREESNGTRSEAMVPPPPSAVKPGNAARAIKQEPFCWQSKAALRLIREAFDGENTVPSALAIYVALTEIASDKQSETFQTTHSWIAALSGWSSRTVRARLKALQEIKLIEIITPDPRFANTYRLLSRGNGFRPGGNRCLPGGDGTKITPLPRSEESNEESTEERRKPARKPPTRSEVWTLEKQIRSAEEDLTALEEANAYEHRRTKESVAALQAAREELAKLRARHREAKV